MITLLHVVGWLMVYFGLGLGVSAFIHWGSAEEHELTPPTARRARPHPFIDWIKSASWATAGLPIAIVLMLVFAIIFALAWVHDWWWRLQMRLGRVPPWPMGSL